MASEHDQEQLTQQPAQQQEQPPSSPRNDEPIAAEGGTEDTSSQGSVLNITQPPIPSCELEADRPALFPEDDGDTVSIPSDAPSEQVTSPSVSVPPYWFDTHTHQEQNHLQVHGPRHARAVSSSSVDSVLPPGAITLQDNEREDDDDDNEHTGRRSNSSELYGRNRNRACWARSVQVTDYVLVNGSTTNIGAFVVWNIRVETLNGSRMNIRKRYSEFDDLRRWLVQTFPNFEAAVPALPPKSVLKRFQPRFLEKRRAGLQYFLNCILLNPEFSGSPVLKEFLFS
ncbi:Phox-like protein [Parathielavia appendiculata]|uniref:Endosomal/vacuolar adapter protein YPT35 n=1 Tax=Parathielavia appendiculata TaxID=2587402 RepID=A0AAN6UBA2_9PEZI|nr:Phox-like protein [Parathielavia appendiculata]